MSDEKLKQSLELLSAALAERDADPANPLRHTALAKAFEVTFEHVWKHFKREADGAGLEVYSPRDALKAAAQLRLVDDPAIWNEYLNARNLSVHDYVGMGDEEFAVLIRRFHAAVGAFLD